jgi:hypothetical protein
MKKLANVGAIVSESVYRQENIVWLTARSAWRTSSAYGVAAKGGMPAIVLASENIGTRLGNGWRNQPGVIVAAWRRSGSSAS